MKNVIATGQAVAFRGLALLLVLWATASAGACDYAEVDRKALAAPPAAERSVGSLGRYLAGCGESDRERARAVFTWVATDISYDASLLGKTPDASSVLRHRRAVCAGYAVLFKALAEAAGLEAEVIYGEARGVGPKPARSSDGLIHHDWSAIKIEGGWALVDCAWGAGQLDAQGRFRPRFDGHYFLTPPRQFAYDHLPKEPKWQLLDEPLSRTQFLQQVEVHPAFFDYGLRLVSHAAGRIEASSRVTIAIETPSDVSLMASLHRSNTELPEGSTFAQRVEDGYRIEAVFPKTGSYVLKVHARRQGSEGQGYDCALEYRVHATAADDATFPKMYLTFQEERCTLDEPMSGVLPVNTAVRFILSAPEAQDVLVFCDGSATHLNDRGDGVFAGPVTLGRGEAIVFAKYQGNSKHLALLRYTVR